MISTVLLILFDNEYTLYMNYYFVWLRGRIGQKYVIVFLVLYTTLASWKFIHVQIFVSICQSMWNEAGINGTGKCFYLICVQIVIMHVFVIWNFKIELCNGIYVYWIQIEYLMFNSDLSQLICCPRILLILIHLRLVIMVAMSQMYIYS